MRIISSPASVAPLHPVRAPDAAENRTHRDQAPTAAPAQKPVRAEANAVQMKSGDRIQIWGDQGMVGTGVTAQKVFHAIYGDRPESSLTEANRAYTKTDSLRFRETPFNLRVV